MVVENVTRGSKLLRWKVEQKLMSFGMRPKNNRRASIQITVKLKERNNIHKQDQMSFKPRELMMAAAWHTKTNEKSEPMKYVNESEKLVIICSTHGVESAAFCLLNSLLRLLFIYLFFPRWIVLLLTCRVVHRNMLTASLRSSRGVDGQGLLL